MKLKELSPFKKTLNECWINLLAALVCFGSTGIDYYLISRHLPTSNYVFVRTYMLFAVLSLALGIVNIIIYCKMYNQNKLNDSMF